MNEFLAVALDVAFFALFGLTFLAYLRTRTRVARDTAIVFGSVAGVLAISVLGQLGIALPGITNRLAAVLLLAQPFLTLRLVENFRPGIRRAVLVSGVVFLASSAVFLLAPAPQPVVTLGIIAAFVGVELLAAYFLWQEAERRIGAARGRLRLAALGTLLFAGAVLVVGAASAAGRGGPSDPTLTAASRVVALLAGVAYLAAFVPPMWLRHFWGRSAAYEFMRELAMRPVDGGEAIWDRLVSTARRVAGARMVVIVRRRDGGSYAVEAAEGARGEDESRETPADADGTPRPETGLAATDHAAHTLTEDDLAGRVIAGIHAVELDVSRPGIARMASVAGAERAIAVPISGGGVVDAALLMFTARGPLFVEDDLAVLEVIAEHAARAVDRERVLAERAALVEQLRRINAELAHASAAKSEFLAGMSHELRTPLHAVIGFSELLTTPEPGQNMDPTVAEYAGHIHGAGLHLLELINDVLDLAKIEAGKLELQYQEFDLAALVNRTGKMMRPLAVRKGVELTFPDATGVRINADAARVRQILFNLLSNAVKFTPSGGRVDVTLDERDGTAVLTVRDTGPGIGPDDQRRIFEPFEQSEATRGRTEGTGLGLAVSRQLAEAHGGRIELESTLGEGSTFRAILPLRVDSAQAVAEPAPTSVAPGPAEPGERLILVAEDDPRASELLAIHLRAGGYRVAIARDGMSAITEAERLRPDAIVLDVMLPVLDGWEVLEHLKDDERTCSIPVVIVSVVDDAAIGFALGAVDYLVKPVSREMLVAAVRRAIGERTSADAIVLAIDDDRETLNLYEAELGRAGYTVQRAATGEEGLKLAVDQRPDAILLDLLMPGMDGWEVASRLQADPRTADVPIIVMTSHDLTAQDRERLQGKVRQIVQKGPDAVGGLLTWLSRVTGAEGGAAGETQESTAMRR